jgi:hypothetical protein
MASNKFFGENNIFLILAVVAVTVSIISAGFTYLSVANLISEISGYATSTGQANLSVESTASLNFTTSYISWGSGRVNTGQTFASLTTLETGNVTNGNWSLVQSGGFRIQNDGTTNVSIDLLSSKSNTTFIGGTFPYFFWNLSTVESNACTNATGNGTAGINLGLWQDVNTTSPGTRYCGFLNFYDALDAIRIDINMSIPYDSTTGALTDTLTVTANSA